jgi:hypothetical protein
MKTKPKRSNANSTINRQPRVPRRRVDLTSMPSKDRLGHLLWAGRSLHYSLAELYRELNLRIVRGEDELGALYDFASEHRAEFGAGGRYHELVPVLELHWAEAFDGHYSRSVSYYLADCAWRIVDAVEAGRNVEPAVLEALVDAGDVLFLPGGRTGADSREPEREESFELLCVRAVETAKNPLTKAARVYNLLAADSCASVRPDSREPPRKALQGLLNEPRKKRHAELSLFRYLIGGSKATQHAHDNLRLAKAYWAASDKSSAALERAVLLAGAARPKKSD